MNARDLWRAAYRQQRFWRSEYARDCSEHNRRAYLSAIRARRDLESCRTWPAAFQLAAAFVH